MTLWNGKKARAREKLKKQYDKAVRDAHEPDLGPELASEALKRAQAYAGILALEHHTWYTERLIAYAVVGLITFAFGWALFTHVSSTEISLSAQTDRFSGRLAKDWAPADLIQSDEVDLSRVTRISSSNLGITFPSGNVPRSDSKYADLSLKGGRIAVNSLVFKKDANVEFILGLHQIVIFVRNSTLDGHLVVNGQPTIRLNNELLPTRRDSSPEFIDFEMDSPTSISTQLVFRDRTPLAPQLGAMYFDRLSFFGVDNLSGDRISGLKAAGLKLHDVKDKPEDFVEDELLTVCGVQDARIAVHSHNWGSGGETIVADPWNLTEFPGSVHITLHGEANHILSLQTQETAVKPALAGCIEAGHYRDHVPTRLETFYYKPSVTVALAVIGALWGLAWAVRHLFTTRRTP